MRWAGKRLGLRACALCAAGAALCTALVALSGCGFMGSGKSDDSQGVDTAVRTVTDAYGREVTVPADVSTCATVGSAARIVVYAGGQDALIAVTEKDTPASPTRPYTVVCADRFASLPTTSNGNHLLETSVDAEALLALEPDVIISSRSAQECEDLQSKIGIPVLGVSYQDDLFSDDVYASITVVGEALGTAEHAQQVIAAMRTWADDLQERASRVAEDERPSAYVGAVNYKGAKSFGGTYRQYAPFDAADVRNVADEMGGSGSVEVSLEQLGEWDPDFLFLNMDNSDLLSADYADNAEFFDQLTAFRTDAIYSQPSFNYNGTNIEVGICDAYFVGATVYPDAFADIDLAQKYDEIFTTMLGVPYYDTMRSLGMDFEKVSGESGIA